MGGSSLQAARQLARHSKMTTIKIYTHSLEAFNNSRPFIINSVIFRHRRSTGMGEERKIMNAMGLKIN
ncbi:hypothetical protein TAO_0293 [Candidatus Nitrosoglobus terrae]|uniref:Uncharacterized protein n=1 Tax=Candidatus Nitrosoglobus terrae TaxID=1630141 RepID=A0A1Q2SKM8_9GAMM|nr:hypothetical protein [Candidatus Nitrosoglobus terrae]BAW79663.1 hypothetical protein TAO_0293 [Candidatus Nitrosoglobus terrae]